jgi:hypothetical protein
VPGVCLIDFEPYRLKMQQNRDLTDFCPQFAVEVRANKRRTEIGLCRLTAPITSSRLSAPSAIRANPERLFSYATLRPVLQVNRYSCSSDGARNTRSVATTQYAAADGANGRSARSL